MLLPLGIEFYYDYKIILFSHFGYEFNNCYSTDYNNLNRFGPNISFYISLTISNKSILRLK